MRGVAISGLLADCAARGVELSLSDGGGLTIDAPEVALTPELLTELREHKAELVAMLDQFEERAAIREYDGKLSRDDAERLAWAEIFALNEKTVAQNRV